MIMNRRSFFYSLAAGVAILLLIGIGGYYWIASQSPLTLLRGGNQTTPAAAVFVSKQAPAMLSILVNPDRLESLRQLVTRPGERRRSRQEINQLKASLLANTGLDYRRDIQPWLGDEITLAVTSLDIDRDQSNGRQSGYLMALTTKDPAKSREFLQLLFSRRAIAGRELVAEQYKGVNLFSDTERSVGAGLAKIPVLTQTTQNNPPLQTQNAFAGAIVGDRFVLFANHPKVLCEAINNLQVPDLNLTSSTQYQQALSLLPEKRFGIAFLNLKNVATWQGLPQPQTYDSQIIGLELNRQGLLAQTTLIAAPDQEKAPSGAMSEPVKALKYIPQSTALTISGVDLSNLEKTNLRQLGTQVVAVLSGSDNDAISRLFTKPLATLQSRWGIDLSKDIFSWVKGEYALGMLSAAEGNPSWIFVTEKTPQSESGIAHLNAIASEQGLSITPLSVGDQKVYAWTQLNTAPAQEFDIDKALLTLKAKVQGVQATVGNYEIFTTSVEAMNAALKSAQIGSVVDSSGFQPSIKAIPQPNQGYVYLDWQASRSIIERQLPIVKLLEVAGKPFFNHLRSLTVSSYGSETGILKGSIFFQFNP